MQFDSNSIRWHSFYARCPYSEPERVLEINKNGNTIKVRYCNSSSLYKFSIQEPLIYCSTCQGVFDATNERFLGQTHDQSLIDKLNKFLSSRITETEAVFFDAVVLQEITTRYQEAASELMRFGSIDKASWDMVSYSVSLGLVIDQRLENIFGADIARLVARSFSLIEKESSTGQQEFSYPSIVKHLDRKTIVNLISESKVDELQKVIYAAILGATNDFKYRGMSSTIENLKVVAIRPDLIEFDSGVLNNELVPEEKQGQTLLLCAIVDSLLGGQSCEEWFVKAGRKLKSANSHLELRCLMELIWHRTSRLKTRSDLKRFEFELGAVQKVAERHLVSIEFERFEKNLARDREGWIRNRLSHLPSIKFPKSQSLSMYFSKGGVSILGSREVKEFRLKHRTWANLGRNNIVNANLEPIDPLL